MPRPLQELRSVECIRMQKSSSFYTFSQCPDILWYWHTLWEPYENYWRTDTAFPACRTVSSWGMLLKLTVMNPQVRIKDELICQNWSQESILHSLHSQLWCAWHYGVSQYNPPSQRGYETINLLSSGQQICLRLQLVCTNPSCQLDAASQLNHIASNVH